MEIWKKFEIDSADYLSKKFCKYASFTRQGGLDSTVSDILVKLHNGSNFYIEAKHCPAQCGQFVLLPNIKTLKFDYSPKNINKFNPYASQIMTEMNMDFDAFKEAGTAGKDIIFKDCQLVFSNWITTIYKNKGVKLIITNDFKVLPIDDFNKAFSISAKYRIKRSGSNSVGKGKISDVIAYLKDHYQIDSSRIDDDKLFVSSSKNLHDSRFYLNGYEYMISKRNEEYEIRRLSNTFNANVIFSIELKPDYKFLTDEGIISLF